MQLAASATAVAASAMVVSAVTAATLFTTAAAAVVMGLELLGGGIAHEFHMAGISHCLPSELVVEVHEDLVVGHFHYLTFDAHAFLSHHGDESARTDVFFIELSLHVENFLLELIDQFGILIAEGLVGLQGKIKFVSLLQPHDAVLEALDEREVHTENKCIGMFLVELEHARLLLAIDNKDFIYELYIFTCLYFLHLIEFDINDDCLKLQS